MVTAERPTGRCRGRAKSGAPLSSTLVFLAWRAAFHVKNSIERAEHIDACLGVADAQALSARFASAGVPFSVPLRRMPYGAEFYVRDPDGYILGFVQPAD